MNSLVATFTNGTYRLVPPEQTLAKITPNLMQMGITRCADVTGLDTFGIPVYCAIRPNARVLQVANGKGATYVSAKVSALMEAIEIFHSEHPETHRLKRASFNQLIQNGLKAISMNQFGNYVGDSGIDANQYLVDWMESEDLISGEKIWIPASTIYFCCEPCLFNVSTNGLASGNHIIEATLHGLYELIERDTISQINVDGRLKVKEKCRVIDLKTIENNYITEMISKIQKAGTKIVLLWVEGVTIPVHTIWAILLNKNSLFSSSMINMGYGTHLDINIATSRAITEAVQVRSTFIHANREDVSERPVYNMQAVELSSPYRYLDSLIPNTSWQSVKAGISFNSFDLSKCCDYLLSELSKTNLPPILRVDLTRPQFNIPVAKIVIPSFKPPVNLF